MSSSWIWSWNSDWEQESASRKAFVLFDRVTICMHETSLEILIVLISPRQTIARGDICRNLVVLFCPTANHSVYKMNRYSWTCVSFDDQQEFPFSSLLAVVGGLLLQSFLICFPYHLPVRKIDFREIHHLSVSPDYESEVDYDSEVPMGIKSGSCCLSVITAMK